MEAQYIVCGDVMYWLTYPGGGIEIFRLMQLLCLIFFVWI